jgi:uncharacterized protein YecT (DUF1311 family)
VQKQVEMRSLVLKLRILIAVIATLGCTACSPKPVAQQTPLNWHPQLDQPIRQLEELLATIEQQQPMNYTSANLGFALDAKLYLLFERYLRSVSIEARPAMLEEQRNWLDQRKQATNEAYAEYEGGTFASFAGNKAFIDATRARIAVLGQRLEKTSVAGRLSDK